MVATRPALPHEPASPWQTLSSEIIYQNPWYALRQDRVRTHLGAEITYTFMEHPGAVAVVPITADGQLVMLRHYRYTLKQWCWEIPMGGLDGREPAELARHELLEEAGGRCQELLPVSGFYTSNGVSNTYCQVFLARDVELEANQPEAGELIHVCPM
ncbi:MAG: NUDIX hydrolase, partial [Anaerolineales bacterium]|nr:NUDIX hydrolase [Anaerolineales bacterium]